MSVSSKALYVQIVNELIPGYGEAEARQLTKILLHTQLNIPFEKILVDETFSVDEKSLKDLDQKIGQLVNFEPIQYVLGVAHFYGRDFYVDKNVLIPRQETEELVKEILIDNTRKGLQILDIGSGSGCIGLTLGLELNEAQITLLDVDRSAMDVSMKNANQYQLGITYLLEDVLELDALPGKYDIIVSNPPYVTEKEKRLMHKNVLNHEPDKALFVPDDDPLIFYQKIIELSRSSLKPKGRLYFEINENYGMEMIRLCERSGSSSVRLMQDLNGKDRFIKAVFDQGLSAKF
jgi:release factor glutamine methyltransferase